MPHFSHSPMPVQRSRVGGKRSLRGGLSVWHSVGMAKVRVSIVFESGARIGPGKAKLLESIRKPLLTIWNLSVK